jgi:hypothetical protein
VLGVAAVLGAQRGALHKRLHSCQQLPGSRHAAVLLGGPPPPNMPQLLCSALAKTGSCPVGCRAYLVCGGRERADRFCSRSLACSGSQVRSRLQRRLHAPTRAAPLRGARAHGLYRLWWAGGCSAQPTSALRRGRLSLVHCLPCQRFDIPPGSIPHSTTNVLRRTQLFADCPSRA